MGGRQTFYGSKGGPPVFGSSAFAVRRICSFEKQVDSHRGRKRAQERNPVTLPNRLASVTLQRSESSAASELESPAFSLRKVKALRQDLFPSRPFVYWGDLLLTVVVAYGLAAVYLSAPARASLAATSNQNPMQLWRNAEVEP
jgi:hypothetical protein